MAQENLSMINIFTLHNVLFCFVVYMHTLIQQYRHINCKFKWLYKHSVHNFHPDSSQIPFECTMSSKFRSPVLHSEHIKAICFFSFSEFRETKNFHLAHKPVPLY